MAWGDIRVDFDTRKFSNTMEKYARQVPFATALALTRTAQDAQLMLRVELKRHMTVRGAWSKGSIKIRRATKRQLWAEVGSVEDYMRLMAKGGHRRPGSDPMGIPFRARPRPTSRTTPGKFPGKLEAKPNYYIGPLPSGDEAVFKRVGGKRKPGRQIWYVLTRRPVRVRKRWPFRATVGRVVRERWPYRMRESWAEAIRTAR